MSTTHEPLLLTYEQAAQRLGVKVSWLETHVQDRSLPHTRMGRLVGSPRPTCADIIEQNRMGAIPSRRRR